MYTPIKVVIKGTSEGGESDFLPALAHLPEAFSRERDFTEEMLHARVDQKLHELCFGSARSNNTGSPPLHEPRP